uniref:Uncharacterized protein n=1 Tax=Anguilla anguilla TaxID=7936 RepID=A0A0E9Q0H3_ANGAN
MYLDTLLASIKSHHNCTSILTEADTIYLHGTIAAQTGLHHWLHH